jgi:hypothetical protein
LEVIASPWLPPKIPSLLGSTLSRSPASPSSALPSRSIFSGRLLWEKSM